MPYHTGHGMKKKKKKKKNKKKKRKQFMVKASSIRSVIKGLSTRQKKTMRRHSRHHSMKHMREMASAMKKGRTFGQAHRSAMRKVGK